MMTIQDFKYKQIAIHRTGTRGEHLKFRNDNILIENDEGHVLFQNSCHRLFALFIIGDTTLTSVAIQKAVAFSFPLILMNRNLKVIASVGSPAEGNTLLRKKQYEPSERHLEIARQIIKQKIQNQLFLLRNLRKSAKDDRDAADVLQNIHPETAQDIRQLMGLEGYASKCFFTAYFRPLGWQRREPRCKHDIYNLLLDIGYMLLFHFIEAMLSLYGFDLYCGVLHQFFYERKSLVCDLVEPFRCIIDHRLRKAHALKQINPEDFSCFQGQYRLDYKKQTKYIALFLKDILAEKEAIFSYCQSYYRAFIRDKPADQFPVYTPQPKKEESTPRG